MRARLYGMAVSHPANAARLMLEHKGIAYEWLDIPIGLQVVRVPLAGFSGTTVPALKLGERKAQGSRAISRLLDEVRPDPPLFPADRRAEVEEAEAWGDRVLQPIPRRLLRHALHHDVAKRELFVRKMGLPAAPVLARTAAPMMAFFAHREEAHSVARIRTDWAALPDHLDRVDDWIADGLLDGKILNAADFQIGTTLRVMLSFEEDFRPLMEGRPLERLARRVWPEFDQSVPRLLPDAV